MSLNWIVQFGQEKIERKEKGKKEGEGSTVSLHRVWVLFAIHLTADYISHSLVFRSSCFQDAEKEMDQLYLVWPESNQDMVLTEPSSQVEKLYSELCIYLVLAF